MKIDRTKLKRGSSEVPIDCRALIDKLKSCNQDQLLVELKQIKSWTCGKCELYHWVDILDTFDDILGRCCEKQSENQWSLPCDSPYMDPKTKELLMHILSFTALLIEHSFSRHLYSSMDHLITLLSSSDMQIVLSVLGLLFVFSKRSNFIGKLSIDRRQELLTRLSYMAESWGGKENGFGLADCCRDLPLSSYPPSSTTLHFEYYTEHNSHKITPPTSDSPVIPQALASGKPEPALAAQSASSVLKNSSSPFNQSQQISKKSSHSGSASNDFDKKSINIIHIDNVDQIEGESIATIMERLVSAYEVPREKQMQLFTHLRLAHCFSDPIRRMQCVQARLQALSIVIYCAPASSQEIGAQLLYHGFIEELVDILHLEGGNEYVDIKSAALRTLTAVVHLDRNSRLSAIIEATETSSYHGFLPVLVRNCIQSLINDDKKFPIPYATALFSFLYHLASYDKGGDALVACGMMESLLKIISWDGSEIEHITFVTRSVRVIDLITNIDMSGFQSQSGLNIFVERLEAEVKICRKELCDDAEDVEMNHNIDETSSDSQAPMDVDSPKPPSNSMSICEPVNHNSQASVEPSATPCKKTGLNLKDLQCYTQRAALLKSMLNFLKKAVQDSTFSDCIRHLMDGSLPKSLRHIISNANYYGSSLFLLSIELVSVYVFQEPALLSSLQESQLTKDILDAILDKPLPPTREILGALPNTFSALCLNNAGLQAFQARKPFEKIFRVLISPEYLPAMKRRKADLSNDTATNLGNSMDELMRHQPSLRADVVTAIINLLKDLCELGDSPNYICCTKPSTKLAEPVPSLAAVDPRTSHPNTVNEDAVFSDDEDDDDDDSASPPVEPNRESQPTTLKSTLTPSKASAPKSEIVRTPVPLVDYIQNVMRFVDAILTNNSTDDHVREFMRQDGLAPLLRLMRLKNLPIDFPTTPACAGISNVCRSILGLARDPRVVQEALKCLDEVLKELDVLHKPLSSPGGSVLLEEYGQIASNMNISDPNVLSNLTPILHSMSAAHAYVSMFSCITRSNHVDTRNICINHWGKDRGLEVLKKMSRLFMALVWESTVLITITKGDQSNQTQTPKNSAQASSSLDNNYGLTQLDRIPIASCYNEVEMDEQQTTQNASSSDATPVGPEVRGTKTDSTQTTSSMDVDDTSKSSTERRSKSRGKRILVEQSSKGLIRPLSVSTSRLSKGLAELFALLVKLSVGSPLRHRRNNHPLPNAPTIPSTAAQNVSSVFAKLITDGLSWELPSSLPKHRPTFFIFFANFTQQMLFDERKNPYHLMLRDLVQAGGLDAFFKCFGWVISESSSSSTEDPVEPTVAASEFLESWLPLLEKMVNPKTILESPHSMAPKSHSAIGYNPFDVTQYLITIHKRAFDAVDYLWSRRSKKCCIDQTSDHILSILCHILKGEGIINESVKREKESEGAVGINLAPSGSISSGSQTLGRQEYPGLNEEQLQQLVDMGFAREAVIDAMMQCQTIEQATEFLLSTPQASSNWSAPRPAESANQDVDMATEEITDQSKDVKPPEVNKTQEREEPLSKARMDAFTEDLLPGALRLMDELPSTVYKVCDLILTVVQRNGDEWCANLLKHLLDDIMDQVKRLLDMAKPLRANDKKSFAEWTSQLKNAPEANKVAARVHLYSLLFDEWKIQCAEYLYNNNALDCLISLLEVGLDLFSLSREYSADMVNDMNNQVHHTPKWLAPTILLIDLYEKGAVASQRRAPLINNMQRTWQYFEERYSRWTHHTPTNNKIIDEAYRTGEHYVRYSVGRKHYLAQFSSMVQISEESTSLKPIMMTLTPAENTEENKDHLLPMVARLRDHQSKTLIRVCVGLMQLPIDPNSLQAVMRLSFRLTRNYELAVMFAEMGGIRALQNLPGSSQFNGFVSLATLIIRHVIEEPPVLLQTMEKVIRSTTQQCQHNQRELHYLLRALGSAACRNEETFKKLATEILRITRQLMRGEEDDPRIRPDSPQFVKLLPPKPSPEPIKPSPVTRCLIADLLDSLTIPIYMKPFDLTSQTRPTGSPPSPVIEAKTTHDLPRSPASFSLPGLKTGSSIDMSKGGQMEPTVKQHNSLMNHSIVLRLLAELTRSYSVVPRIISEHVFTPSTNESISEDVSALAFILDNILPATQTHSDRDGPPLARVFLAALAACNHCVEAQISVVNEVKASLIRAASMPESCEKHARLQSLAIMIGTMIECCPAVTPQPPSSRQNGSNANQQRFSNNIVRLFVRKGLVTDLAKIPHSLDLSAPHMFATVNAILKPLETLSRFVNMHNQPNQSRHHAPPTKKTCSTSSSSSEIHDRPATPSLTIDTSSANQQTDEGGLRQTDISLSQEGGNEMVAEPRDNVVSSNGAESESGDESRSDDDEEEDDEDNGEVSGVDEREEDVDDEDEDDDDDDEDEDHVDDDEDHVDDDDGDDDEILNASGDNQFAEDYRVYNGHLSVLDDIGEVLFNRPNVLYSDRLSNIVPGVYESSIDQHESSAPSLPPPPGVVGLTHPLLLRRLDNIQTHPSMQAPDRPSVITSNRGHRYARPRLLGGPPTSGPRWHGNSALRQPQTILQQLLGPSVQEVISLTNQIVGPGRLFVADFQQFMGPDDDVYQEVGEPHTITTTQTTALSSIPMVMSRWSEESRILDGGSIHDCLSNLKLEIIPALEKYEEEENLERQEKRKKITEDKDSAQQKKSEEPVDQESLPLPMTTQLVDTPQIAPNWSQQPPTIPEEPPVQTSVAEPAPVLMPGASNLESVAQHAQPAPVLMTAQSDLESEAQQRDLNTARTLEAAAQCIDQLAAEEATKASSADGMIPEGVDPSFLAALPEDIRQEVLAEQWRLRRLEQASTNRQSTNAPSQPSEQPSTSAGTAFPEVNPEFLAALPAEVQEEVLAQQRAEQQRQAALNSNPDQPVDPANFIQTLAPNLRRQVLADMDDSVLSLLPTDLAAEAHALRRELLSSNATANSTLSRLLRTAAAGRMQRARYTIASVSDHGHRQHPPWGWALDPGASLSHGGNSSRNLLALTRDSKLKGRQLLDSEALTCLLILLFVEDSKLNIALLHRVIKNLSYHHPTRRWVLQSLLSIIDRSRGNDELSQGDPAPIRGRRGPASDNQATDLLKLNHSSSWMSISMDAALGCRASVFSVRRPNVSQSDSYLGKNISIHHQAAASVCRHILDALIALAKTFPHQFFPESLQSSDDHDSDSTTLSPEFWDILARLDSALTIGGKKSRSASKQTNAITPGVQSSSSESSPGEQLSPLARLMGFLAHPVVKRSFTLTDRLLHLLAVISTAFPFQFDHVCGQWMHNQPPPRTGNYARRGGHLGNHYYARHIHSHRPITAHYAPPRGPPVPRQAHDNQPPNETDRNIPGKSKKIPISEPTEPLVSKPYLKLAVDVLTSKSCSEEGLDDVTSLLSRLSRSCTLTKTIVLELLMEGARQLGQTVCQHISTLKCELQEYNQKTRCKASSSNNDANSPSAKGVVQDRFTSDSVIIIAPSGSKSASREIQLPSMASLTSKNSSQSFFLRILKVIIQLRDSSVPVSNSQTPQASNSTQQAPAQTPAQQLENLESSVATGSQSDQPAMKVDTSINPNEPTTNIKTEEETAKKDEDSLSIELLLDNLWETLSQCLLELAETPDHHAVLVLQPAVEAFFLVHSPGSSQRKRHGHDDNVERNSQTAHIDQEVAPISPSETQQQGEGSTVVPGLSYDTQKFLKFADTHRVVLNHILRQSGVPLSQGPFAVLVDHTRVLDFDVKRRYFRQELERLDEGIRRDDLGIHVRRDNVFEESFRELHRRMAEEWKNRFFVVFEDEEGQDAGGLLREWYTIISREIFNPMYALFTTSPGDRVTYMINSASHCNSNHLSYFKFVGRVIAKAIYDNKLLDCYFTRSFYKHILGKPVKYTDMESEDYSFYQGLVFLLEHDVKELGYELTFSVEVREFGVTEVRELKPNGANIPVTEENKQEYVRLVCQEKMTGSIRKQLNAFLEGFYDIIPKRLISIFNEQELELLISGLPNIDIDDLKASTEYHKYLPNSLQIQWFWRALRSFDQADRAKLLQFVTGTSKVPLQGFASLEGMNGVQKFQIHRDERSTDRLPSAHTCFNQLDLPVYETYDKLRYMLLKAIQECSEGFGLA